MTTGTNSISANRTIKTAVLPVAGLGTRLLPATKVMPKEMLPIVDMPLIQLAVNEARAAGIERFIFVINNGKEMLLQHFDDAPQLMEMLVSRNKQEQIQKLQDMALPEGQPQTAYQRKALGLGHAVWCARHLVDNEPFAVLLPDDFILGDKPCLPQMADEFVRTGHNIVAAMEVADTDVSKYGIIDPVKKMGRAISVKGFVEKPSVEETPSNLAVVGRYILQPEIMNILDDLVTHNSTGAGGEIQLTDAMVRLLETSPFTAYNFEGERFDCGSDIGFVKAQIAYAMTKPHLIPELTQFMVERLRKNAGSNNLAVAASSKVA